MVTNAFAPGNDDLASGRRRANREPETDGRGTGSEGDGHGPATLV
jgi:hypothetical protein